MANRRRENQNRSRKQKGNSNFKRRNRGGVRSKPKLSDARQKILSKKRKSVTDARDILTNMAKTQDARSKLLRIRESKVGDRVVSGSIRAIGSNILQRTDRNGKISLMTNKNKQSTSDINLAIQQQLGLIAQVRKRPPTRKERRSSPVPHKTVLKEYAPPSLPMLWEAYNDYLYPRRYRVERRQSRDDWPRYVSHIPRGYVDLDAPEEEEMPLIEPPFKHTISMQGTGRLSNVHSRLDTSPPRSRSQAAFEGPSKTKIVVPAGHRIVVSNLQGGVTEDDIRELFEDIGQLLVARLVRSGTAEVIYKNLKDAQRAVDTYHNRQLDGQPMKCLLVNKRPFNDPLAPALTISKQSSGSGRSILRKPPVSKSSTDKLVPDLETIHKVLFQR